MPPFGHRVARIDDEVYDRVGELRFIGVDRPEIGALIKRKIAFAQQMTLEQDREIADDVADLQHFRLRVPFAREGQKLTDQCRRTQRVLVNC